MALLSLIYRSSIAHLSLIYRSAGLFVALLLLALLIHLPRALIYRSSIAHLSLICGDTTPSARCYTLH
jgi:hypothetical protein